MATNKDVLTLIGNTPMVKVSHIDTGPCELFLKLENQNPGGSIKDRIALSMIEAAERSGELKPDGVLIEATVGNTRIELAPLVNKKALIMEEVIIQPVLLMNELLPTWKVEQQDLRFHPD